MQYPHLLEYCSYFATAEVLLFLSQGSQVVTDALEHYLK